MLVRVSLKMQPMLTNMTIARQLNANRCVVTKIKRANFTRMYPTTAVLPDGSTISVKYPTPMQLIRFPIVMETATEEDKRKINLRRRPKQTLVVQEDRGSSFDPMKYVKN